MIHKNKIVKSILLSLLTLLLASSCSTNLKTDHSSVSSQSNSNMPHATNSQLSLLTSPDGYSDKTFNSKGFYTLINLYPNSCNLVYTDFSTNNQIFLCSKPECAHNTTACSSFIEIEVLNPGIVCTEENVFIFYCDEKSATAKQCIEKRDLTGDNPTIIYEIPAEQRISSGIAADKDNLYFIASTVKATGTQSELLQINHKDNTASSLIQLNENNYIMGTCNNDLIIKNINNVEFENQKHVLNSFNIETKKYSQNLYSWTQGEKLGVVSDGKFYYLDFAKSIVGTFSFEDLSDNYKNASISTNADNVIINGVYDDNLLIEQIDGMVNEYTLIVNSYAVNTTSGESSQINLVDNFNNRPIKILTQCGDSFLVQTATVETKVTLEDLAGTPYQQSVYSFEYAMISKTDFYNSVENYKPIGNILSQLS